MSGDGSNHPDEEVGSGHRKTRQEAANEKSGKAVPTNPR
jgi:hypothetical protein